MPNTHDVGPFFVHIQKHLAPSAPLLHIAPTNEIVPPFRKSPNSRILKIWPGIGLVFGRWYPTNRREQEALIDAIIGRTDAMTTDDIRDNAHRFDEDLDDLIV